jgi:hypothetical protein
VRFLPRHPAFVSFVAGAAIATIPFSLKFRPAPKLDQSLTAELPIIGDAKPEHGDSGSRHDAAHSRPIPLACKDASMARANLRIYRGPADSNAPARSASTSPSTVTVNLGEVLPLLADAVASRRTWLGDFEDDEITISADLYEVLLAYQYFRHPAA